MTKERFMIEMEALRVSRGRPDVVEAALGHKKVLDQRDREWASAFDGYLNMRDISLVLGAENVRYEGDRSFVKTDDGLGIHVGNGSSAVNLETFIWGEEAEEVAAALIERYEGHIEFLRGAS